VARRGCIRGSFLEAANRCLNGTSVFSDSDNHLFHYVFDHHDCYRAELWGHRGLHSWVSTISAKLGPVSGAIKPAAVSEDGMMSGCETDLSAARIGAYAAKAVCDSRCP
jgi:hypothetical protein